MRNLLFFALVLAIIAGTAHGQGCLPLKHLYVTSAFGDRVHPLTGIRGFHAGVDLRAHRDTVYAVLFGRVTRVGYDPLLGLFIKVASGPFGIIYGHLSQYFVTDGLAVSTHTPLGVTGSTGQVTAEHLHFAVKFHRRCIEPLAFLAAIIKNNQ